MLSPLPTAFFEEASYSGAAGVLNVFITVRDLEPPKLNDSSDVGIDRTFCK
jgi:hypothetical protein